MLGIIGIIISLALLMFLAYKGISVLILAPVLAILAVLFQTGQSHILANYTEVFMVNFAGYVKAYFPVFLLGAIFGKIMDDSGAAKSIAYAISSKLGKNKAILAVVLSCAILTYGGVSLFVVAFAVYPIAAALFRDADIPKRLLPASIALGAFTFTMTALPGTPQIQNAIPMPFFGTTVYAAPIIGLIGASVMFGGGMFWLTRRSNKAKAAGEGYGDHKGENIKLVDQSKLPKFTASIVPILLVLIVNYILGKNVFANMDGSYLKDFGNISPSAVIGIWSLIASLVVSIIVSVILFWKNFDSVKDTLNKGALGSLLAIANTASEVGYGNVIKTLAAFAVLQAGILAIPGTPLISLAASTSILAGITGSASGGMSIALGILGETYLQKAQVLGINPQVLHRIAAMACGGLDTLPHNGAVITLLGITGLNHKQSYADIGMVTLVIPLIAVAVSILFASMGVV
ncbi:GntP family permease [Clostridium sp.]|uniref:GntP family permease n=1 Tax=Clostridium sp. TaxID=1506 RepID=UPI001A50E6B8|nr:GntP family permease [Clostridium sp.]MBK5241073.1 GntP family permease [Clostridium sp.]